MLIAAGCRHIQIDEPLFTVSTEEEDVAGRGRSNQSSAIGITEDMHFALHICKGTTPSEKNMTAKSGTAISTPAVIRRTLD